jgi:hypothetical protein
MYWVTGILGLLLALAPFMFGYSNNAVAMWTSLFIGGATMVVSIVEGVQADREKWEYWAALALGLIAVVSPFVLGFGEITTAMWSTVVLGVLIAVFAGSRLTTGHGRRHMS